MAIRMSKVIEQLRRFVLAGGEAELTDGQLLECFVSERDDAAMAALVRRHACMVWGVCSRVLSGHHDIEDAFQATFLVLVRRAAAVQPREMVANWLYGVAHQTALKARAIMAKRKAREKQVKEMPEAQVGAGADLWSELQPCLDQELSQLADKYRATIVLCDLEGKTRKEAARQLKIPESTLSTRLMRARAMLAKRLTRHGLALAAGAVGTVLSEKAATASVPASALSSTIKAVTLVAAGNGTAAGAISANVAALTDGVMKSMLLVKLKIAAGLLIMFSMVSFTSAMLVGGGQAKSVANSGIDEVSERVPARVSAEALPGAELATGRDGMPSVGDGTVATPQNQKKLDQAALDQFWDELASKDNEVGKKSVRAYASSPKESVPYLSGKVFRADFETIEMCIRNIDAQAFTDRKFAFETLQSYGRWIEGHLRRALKDEQRKERRQRLEGILERLQENKSKVPYEQERLRARRVMEILEQVATPQARELLGDMAMTSIDQDLREAAQAALKRIK